MRLILGLGMEKDILSAIYQLLSQGKTPTVATVKSKMTSPVAMPIIIKALQLTSTMTLAQIEAQLSLKTPPHASIDSPSDIEKLQRELLEVKCDLAETKQELAQLKDWLSQQLDYTS